MRLLPRSCQVSLKPSAVDLRALLDMAGDSVRLRAEQKNLAFGLAVDSRLPSLVMVDGQRLRQVLLNLLSNAVKFTEQGEVVLTVTARPLGERYEIGFSVRDTGIGLSEASLAKLFQRFSQADASTSRKYGGKIGRASCRERVSSPV